MANGIYKDPEARRAYLKSYYKAHKATMDKRSKDYYQKHKEALKRANNERYRAKCMNELSKLQPS